MKSLFFEQPAFTRRKFDIHVVPIISGRDAAYSIIPAFNQIQKPMKELSRNHYLSLGKVEFNTAFLEDTFAF
jgi:hypothetical protein